MNTAKIDYNDKDAISRCLFKLRNSYELDKALAICKIAGELNPDEYFYPKIEGDLLFEKQNYKAASEAYLLFLQTITENTSLFNDFAKRYFKLRRVLNAVEIAEYSEKIMMLMKAEFKNAKLISLCEDLIKSDLPKVIEISKEGEKFIELLNDDSNLNSLVVAERILEANNPFEIEFILDNYILDRERDKSIFGIDSFFLSIYEKLGRHTQALKIAAELLEVKQNAIIVRSMLRICRKLHNYTKFEDTLTKYPGILKSDDFNVLYELVYYYEQQKEFDEVKVVLNNIERLHFKSLPIQKTVQNFYVRFGLLEDASRVDSNISKLYLAGRKSTRFETEVKESQAKIWSTIKELSTELEHQRQLSAISALTTGISHELGQPITNIRYTIQFYSRIIERAMDKEIVFKVFDSVLEETERMGGLIKRLSPLTSTKSTIEDFDVIERINRRIKAENAKLTTYKIIATVSPINPIIVTGDPVKYDQLFSNLILNAIDSIKERNVNGNHEIKIAVKNRDNDIIIIFDDTGVGIPIRNRKKIFEPFFSTKAPGKGEGLGLFIVWNLLKTQNGTIDLDYNYKKGARFVITIPKKQPH